MKSSTLAVAAALTGSAAAFPAQIFEELAKRGDLPAQLDSAAKAKRQVGGVNVGFDPAAQYISTTGQYAFEAPGPNDIRGPCPGLNALANHNYLPHNGVANIQQFIDTTNSVFGMGLDLSTFLSVYGAVFDGDLLTWSIGGPPPSNLLSPVSGLLLGTPQGISGSHNKYEADVSPTRGDLFVTGNDYLALLDRFKDLYALQASETEETSNYDLGVLTTLRGRRFNESITTNPYFFNGPFSGVLVQPAAYTFIYRFMANKSAEFPEGRLSQNVLKDFFSITGDTPDEFVYTPGYERIPDNWYKRAIGDEYTIPFFLLDVLAAAEEYPQFLDVGGNTGTVGSFTGVNLQDLTGGLFNTATLAEGDNLACFVYQLIRQAAPDILEGLTSQVINALDKLQSAADGAFGYLSCPQLEAIQQDQFVQQFQQFPGITQLQDDGTYDTSAAPSVLTKSGHLKAAVL